MRQYIVEKVLKLLWRELIKIARIAWDAPFLQKPHLIASAFYVAIVLSHAINNSPSFGLRAMSSGYLDWRIVLTLFGICGFVLAQKRSAYIYAVCTLPMAGYASMLLIDVAIFEQPFELNAIYLSFAVLSIFSGIRQHYEFERYARAIIAMRDELKVIAEKEQIPQGKLYTQRIANNNAQNEVNKINAYLMQHDD